jgi:hypothetical protein
MVQNSHPPNVYQGDRLKAFCRPPDRLGRAVHVLGNGFLAGPSVKGDAVEMIKNEKGEDLLRRRCS